MKKRIVFVGNGTSSYTTTIFKGFYKNMESVNCELVLNIDAVPLIPNERTTIEKLKFIIKKGLNSDDFDDNHSGRQPFNMHAPLVPCKQVDNINDPSFLNYLSSLSPDYAILVGCPQIVEKEFLSCFNKVINMHASLLPRYRGLDPVSWAMFNSEPTTGYTFHYVNDSIDDGNIILQQEIPIDYSKRPSGVMTEIAQKAGETSKAVLERLVNNYEGTPQTGKKSYYGSKAKNNLLTVYKLHEDDNLQKKIRFFGYVKARYKGSWVHITRVDNNGKIRRVHHLPPTLFQLLKNTRNTSSQVS